MVGAAVIGGWFAKSVLSRKSLSIIANAIQRFDPMTEAYETFPSDKKSANVRQMLGRPGEAWGGESGTDRLVVIRD